MRKLANADIREAAKEAGVSLWELADEMNVSEPTLTRMLRHELSDYMKADLMSAIAIVAMDRIDRDGH